ncbi:MAG: hypothetical protein HW416_3749 [Chloroflexi bacterium]|nr:hypothetical protein [Chloroflexota bacterium]
MPPSTDWREYGGSRSVPIHSSPAAAGEGGGEGNLCPGTNMVPGDPGFRPHPALSHCAHCDGRGPVEPPPYNRLAVLAVDLGRVTIARLAAVRANTSPTVKRGTPNLTNRPS